MISREDLKNMSDAEIVEAHQTGGLDHLTKPEAESAKPPAAGASEEKV